MRESFTEWAKRTGIDVSKLTGKQVTKLVAAYCRDRAAIRDKERNAPLTFKAVPRPPAFFLPVQVSLSVPQPAAAKRKPAAKGKG
jgi:hypothetical protein